MITWDPILFQFTKETILQYVCTSYSYSCVSKCTIYKGWKKPVFRQTGVSKHVQSQRSVWNETHDKNNISMVSVRDKPVSIQERHMGDMELSSSSSRILKELIFQSRGVENGGQLIELIFQSCRWWTILKTYFADMRMGDNSKLSFRVKDVRQF